MLRVHADDAGIVDHLGEDHHGVRRLHDLVEVVVEVVRQRRRSRRGSEPEEAALAEGTAFGIVVGAGRGLEAAVVVRLSGAGQQPRRMRCRAAGVIGGTRPFGGSTTIEVRISPLTTVYVEPGSSQNVL